MDHKTTSAGAKQFHIIHIDPMNDVKVPQEHLMAHQCHANANFGLKLWT
jgi:hypothetical protein